MTQATKSDKSILTKKIIWKIFQYDLPREGMPRIGMLWAISAAAMGQDGRMERIFFFPFSTATATMIGKGGGGGWAWLNSFLSAGAPKRQLIILGSSSFSLSPSLRGFGKGESWKLARLPRWEEDESWSIRLLLQRRRRFEKSFV